MIYVTDCGFLALFQRLFYPLQENLYFMVECEIIFFIKNLWMVFKILSFNSTFGHSFN